MNFSFKHKFYFNNLNVTLKTNKDGIINLGKLKHITEFSATPKESRIVRSVTRKWVIPQ